MPTGEPDTLIECDDVLVAVGQENAFPWIERDIGLEFDRWGMPVVDPVTYRSTIPNVFFGGDAAFGPKNIIWAVPRTATAPRLLDRRLCQDRAVDDRPPLPAPLVSQKMGIHEWTYDNDISTHHRLKVPLRDKVALKDIMVEVELGFDTKRALEEAQRCLNCDVETVFADRLCIECDACVDICRWIASPSRRTAREGRSAPRLKRADRQCRTQDLYVSAPLKTETRHGQGRGRLPCIAVCAPSAVRPAHGTCRNSSVKLPRGADMPSRA